MPRLKGSADLLEDRRKRALALLDSGYSLNEVGRRIGRRELSSLARPTGERSVCNRFQLLLSQVREFSDHFCTSCFAR
jgi:hypothetical protein